MAIGMLEVQGFSIALAAADAMCKAANITLEAFDANNPASADVKIPVIVQVKFQGGISDVNAALEAGRCAGEQYLDKSEVVTRCIPAVSEELMPIIQGGKLKPVQKKNKKEALGVVDVMFFTNAVTALNTLMNTSYLELIDCKKYLGGRMVTIIVGGTVSNVTSALEIVKNQYRLDSVLKNTVVITNPHNELFKFFKEDKQL